MMRLRIEVQPGRLEVDKKLMRATLRAAGAEVAAVARRLIRQSGGTGQLYRGRRASAPGQAPLNQTGRLAGSFRIRVYRSGEGVSITDEARSRTGSGAPYALFLEKGARGGVSSFGRGGKSLSNFRIGADRRAGKVGNRVVEPRPFLTVALDMRRTSPTPRIGNSLNQGIKFVKLKA